MKSLKICLKSLPNWGAIFGSMLWIPLFLMTINGATAGPLSACKRVFSSIKPVGMLGPPTNPRLTRKKTVQDLLIALQQGNKNFRNWDLRNLNLSDLTLRGDFRGADFSGSLIVSAEMSGDFRGANFGEDTIIEDTHFPKAIYNLETKFPLDFEPIDHGMRFSF